jgi:hypothetical protein
VLNGPLMARDWVGRTRCFGGDAASARGGRLCCRVAIIGCAFHPACVGRFVLARYARNRRLGDALFLRDGPGSPWAGPGSRAVHQSTLKGRWPWGPPSECGPLLERAGYIVVRVGPLTTIGPGERKVGCLGSSGRRRFGSPPLSTLAPGGDLR